MAIRPPTAKSVHSPACLLVRPTRSALMATVKTPAPGKSKFRVAPARLIVGSSRAR